ncbi:MAG: prolipoprotein diacylglyceryl transferase [Bacteroidales bacterium]|nr:prolipoprotein diacylglyceryl transferase [Bacteroidales bacterium]
MLAFVTWNVDPVLFSLGPFAVRWYGLMFVIGFFIGYQIVAKMFKHEGAPESWLGTLLTYLVVCTIVGARLGHVFFYEWDYYSAHPAEILKIWNGGLASHGGTIAIIIGMWIFCRFVAHKPMSWVIDKIVAPVALTGCLIRLGNLMNSEIYGAPTDMPWGFLFVRNHEMLPCHPTQLYEAGCYLLLFFLLMWMYWKKNAEERPWLMSGVFFLVTFGSRFIIEYVKNVQVAWELQMRADWGINQGQLLSIPFILLGIGLIIYAMSRPRQHWNFPNKFADEPNKK